MRNIGTKRRGRIIAGGVGAVIGVIYTVLAFQFPMGRPEAPGPGVFPVVVGFFLIAASIGLAIEGLVSSAIAGDIEFPRGPQLVRLAIFGGGTLAYIVVLPYLGLLLATAAFFLLIMKSLGRAGWLMPVILSFVFSGVITVVFVVLLRVPLTALPMGLGF